MAKAIFPKNNLGPDSAYWAREVEKRIKELESEVVNSKTASLANSSASRVSSATISALWARVVAVENNASAGTGSSFSFTQAVPSDTWVIAHNLGFNPNVTVVDSALNTIEGDIQYNSINELTITFSVSVYGTAYLS